MRLWYGRQRMTAGRGTADSDRHVSQDRKRRVAYHAAVDSRTQGHDVLTPVDETDEIAGARVAGSRGLEHLRDDRMSINMGAATE